MLIFNSNSLTIQLVRKFNLAVFSWRGVLSSETFKEGTIQSLETLRNNSSVHSIVLNARNIKSLSRNDIDDSVNSTVDYLGITRANYKMSVIPPIDLLAKESVDAYVDSLNKVLKKRFVVQQHDNWRKAALWLVRPRIFSLFS